MTPRLHLAGQIHDNVAFASGGHNLHVKNWKWRCFESVRFGVDVVVEGLLLRDSDNFHSAGSPHLHAVNHVWAGSIATLQKQLLGCADVFEAPPTLKFDFSVLHSEL